MDTPLCIREEGPDDSQAIRHVHRQAFDGDLEARLVDKLRDADHVVLSLVAVAGDRVVGHVLFSPVTVEPHPGEPRWAALGPIGVLPGHQGRGIGSRLVREGLAGCRTRGLKAVVLLGAPGYYSRFGFVRASDFGLTSVYGSGPEFQAVELTRGSLSASGESRLVRFAPEFEEVSREPPPS